MVSPRRLRFVRALVAWLVGTLLALSVLGSFSYGLFVILAAIGVVTVARASTASSVPLRWRGRLRVFVVLAIVAGSVVAGLRLAQLVAPGVVP